MTWSDPKLLRALGAVLLAAVVVGAVACGGPPPGGSAIELAVAGDGALALPAEPAVETVTVGREQRRALVLPPGEWSWEVTVPEGGWLQLGVGAPSEGAAVGLDVRVTTEADGRREILEVGRRDPAPDEPEESAEERWLDMGVDLERFTGRTIRLDFSAHGIGRGTPGSVAWSPVAVTGGRPAEPADGDGETARPNILVILVDTLRADHLPTYGYERDTAPEIEARLAARGVVVETAYSQAPWTLPSVVSLMTSRHPGELLGDDAAAYGIPEEVPILAEALHDLGYATGAFVANSTLHGGNGFARGFDTFYSPEGIASLAYHADRINERALPWLRAHRDRPFFLYAHYIDPHDPYQNPDTLAAGHRSPWFDDPGGRPGDHMHGLYVRRLPLGEGAEAEREIAHMTALYDSEIRYVDRAIGQLLESIPPDILAETVVVLTSDHGEELFDHGGWKHGHTLYQDQIHVPLVVRWDGRIEPGTRLPGTVRLLDLAPTLVEAAGGEVPSGWQGTSLLPALTGEGDLPRLAAFAQHLSFGPRRAAVVLDGKKLQLFDRDEPTNPVGVLQENLTAFDRERLAPAELYDLAADPGEERNLLGPSAAEQSFEGVERLASTATRHLQESLVGLRAVTEGLTPGQVLTGELTFERAPQVVLPLFVDRTGDGTASGEDSLVLDGATVRFRLHGWVAAKGFLVRGEPGALVAASLTLDGEPLPQRSLRLGAGTAWTGDRVPASRWAVDEIPRLGGRDSGLLLFAASGDLQRAVDVDERTRENLKALGYLQ